MSERREALRRRTLLTGTINLANHAIFDCVICNLSERGARIYCAPEMALPDIFELSIPQRELRQRVRIVWRGEGEFGVEFVEEDDYENVVVFMPLRHLRQ